MKGPQFQLHAQIEEKHWWFLGRRRIVMDLIHQIVQPSPAQTIVDVGCGTGGNIAALGNDYSAIGIDSSPEALEVGKKQFPEVKFVLGWDAFDPKQVQGETPVFLLMDVLEHVSDDSKFFLSVLERIPPGGYLLVTVPANMSLWSPHDEAFGHYRRYDLRRLAQVWEGLPVEVLLLSYFNSHLYPIVKVARWMTQRQKKSLGTEGTDFQMPVGPINRALEWIFASESVFLRAQLKHHRPGGFPWGVSLIALLKRTADPFVPTESCRVH